MEPDQLYKLRHSLSHVLAMAVLEVFPDAILAIGPPVDNGFYYDFELPRPLTPGDLKDLQKRMFAIVNQKYAFVESKLPVAEAREKLKGQPYKLELLEDLAAAGETELGFYQSGPFADMCKGPHLDSLAEVPMGSFELSHIAGAYWKGDEKRPMLQRVYGLAFESKDALSAYKTMMEEAKKRDHRKLGQELDLFTFSDLVGAGLPLWTPKGNQLRLLLDEYVWQMRKEAGYERVEIPHITKKDLYEKSGHWEKFQDELFRITTREGHEFVMKPMNCPHHTQIFDRRKWSYRDMPQRYANTTMCYRDEQSGELSGLSRVRALCQDDAHVFCRYDQVKEEIDKIWTIVERFYSAFGFDLKLRLSFHDPANMSAYLGTPEGWEKSEADLRAIADARGVEYFVGIGEAAFYGPKLDFMATDSIGRKWQVATIQLDMVQPERFGLSYAGADGTEQPVLMIHAAIMGSIDRFLSVMIEHVAGNFPFWLSPVQVSVLSVSEDYNDAADQVAKDLKAAGFRVESDLSNESVGKKIRAASLQKVPAKIVVGQTEVDGKAATGKWSLPVNWRSDLESQQSAEALSFDDLTALMEKLVSEKVR
jgi:threonyl-tRNA synthetase